MDAKGNEVSEKINLNISISTTYLISIVLNSAWLVRNLRGQLLRPIIKRNVKEDVVPFSPPLSGFFNKGIAGCGVRWEATFCPQQSWQSATAKLQVSNVLWLVGSISPPAIPHFWIRNSSFCFWWKAQSSVSSSRDPSKIWSSQNTLNYVIYLNLIL